MFFLIGMSSILIDLVWLLNSCFNIHLTALHFRMFSYNMVFPSMFRANDNDIVFIPAPEYSRHLYLATGLYTSLRYPTLLYTSSTIDVTFDGVNICQLVLIV